MNLKGVVYFCYELNMDVKKTAWKLWIETKNIGNFFDTPVTELRFCSQNNNFHELSQLIIFFFAVLHRICSDIDNVNLRTYSLCPEETVFFDFIFFFQLFLNPWKMDSLRPSKNNLKCWKIKKGFGLSIENMFKTYPTWRKFWCETMRKKMVNNEKGWVHPEGSLYRSLFLCSEIIKPLY